MTVKTTVNALLDRYVIECLPKLSERTQRDYSKYILPKLRAMWGDRIADDIAPREFGEYLYSSPKGQVQRTRELAPLAAAYTCGKGMWWLVKNHPLRDLKKPKSEPRDRLIEDAEFAAVLAMAPYRIRLAMKLSLMTGQRQGDILALKWGQIRDMEIHIQQSKTRKRLAIGIHPELEAVLDECWKLPGGGKDGGEYVICSNKGTRYSSEGFRAMFTRVMRQYALRGGQRFTYHDIRAYAATKCASPEHARRLLGHTNIAMTQRVYRRGIERVQALETSK